MHSTACNLADEIRQLCTEPALKQAMIERCSQHGHNSCQAVLVVFMAAAAPPVLPSQTSQVTGQGMVCRPPKT